MVDLADALPLVFDVAPSGLDYLDFKSSAGPVTAADQALATWFGCMGARAQSDPRQPARYRFRINSLDYMRALGIPTRRFLYKSTERMTCLTVGRGERVFEDLEGRHFDVKGSVEHYLSYKLSPIFRERSGEKVRLDLRPFLGMSCSHTLPFAARAYARLRCPTYGKRMGVEDGARWRIDAKMENIGMAFGWRGDHRPAVWDRYLAPIAADMKILGMDVEFEWIRRRRAVEGLRATVVQRPFENAPIPEVFDWARHGRIIREKDPVLAIDPNLDAEEPPYGGPQVAPELEPAPAVDAESYRRARLMTDEELGADDWG